MQKVKSQLKFFIAIHLLAQITAIPYKQDDYDYGFTQVKFDYADSSSLIEGPKDSYTCSSTLGWQNCSIESYLKLIQGPRMDVLGMTVDNSRLDCLGRRAFAEYEQLRRLYVRYASIDDIESYSLTGLNKLVELNMTHNNIFLIWSGAFNDLSLLESIDLSHNRLLGVKKNTFNGLVNLVLLNLRNNRMMSLSANGFSTLHSLQYLDVSHNQIFYLLNDSSLYDNDVPLKFYLNHNQFSQEKNVILDFSYNNFSKLYMSFDNQPIINTINFSHNRLEFIEPYTFSELQVTILDLSHNQLPNINQSIFTASKIQYLNLSNNYLSSINARFYKNIEHFDLSHNKIAASDLPHNLITNVQQKPARDSLQAINLDNNRIKFFVVDNQNVIVLIQGNNLVEHINSLQFAKLPSNLSNQVDCMYLDKALILLEGSLDNSTTFKGVKGIMCVEGNLVLNEEGDVVRYVYLLSYLLFGLSLLGGLVYYILFICWGPFKITKR